MPEHRSATDMPLVSVIVRSTDRPSLPQALASIATQDYPRIEVVVVGASGPQHSTLTQRCGPHPLQFVRCTAPRNRPQAANTGLDAASGDWITFLDDDDIFLPDHLSGLMAARADAPEAGVIHCFARATFADGRAQRFGQPFCLVQLYARNFLQLSTAVFVRSLLARGCRFDEALLTHQDWDFFLQVAQLTSFHFVPRETFVWHADAGGSGAGGGANHDDETFTRYRDLVYAKWARQRDALIDRVEPLVRSAAQAAERRDFVAAEDLCRAALAISPNDPWALNLRASIERATGRAHEARRTQQLAVAVCPQDPALTFNLALLYRAQGEIELAKRCCDRAVALDADFAPAKRLRAELPA
jgi:glycosyltransferase involved in cell wall biosynthesis